MADLTVLDFFCGAGGFSEGFRQEGFRIRQGYDRWKPAVDTFNHNFGTNGTVTNILDLGGSIDEIENLEDTDVILGSPPCVTFSSSNNSGKADKASGIELTKIFLRIVAVKKWKPNSMLKAWFMENVPRSIQYLPEEYTFADLDLEEWARENNVPSKVALRLEGNRRVLNAANYGGAQTRTRAISGEIVCRSGFVEPLSTHSNSHLPGTKPWHILNAIKSRLPAPLSEVDDGLVSDPNYPHLQIEAKQLTDHFYDTGLYKSEWSLSEYLKTNHPYMGKMSFPEDENRPSRTITATKIGSSREAIVYKSETSRSGHGQFRTATVREAACIMGFPITFQFKGTEGTKWRLVGNAVCPAMSRALARQVKLELGLELRARPKVEHNTNTEGVLNLNSRTPKTFDAPPIRKKNSRFRRHAFKDGNMTVTLSNYDIAKGEGDVGRWRCSIQYGTGNGFPSFEPDQDVYKHLEPILSQMKSGPEFLETINNGYLSKIPKADQIQAIYDNQTSTEGLSGPIELITELASIISQLDFSPKDFSQQSTKFFKDKKQVPIRQLFALYAISRIISVINQ